MDKINVSEVPKIINLVKTPLAFFALSLMIIEGFLAIFAIRSENTILVLVLMSAFFLLTILVVTWLIFMRPERLYAPTDFADTEMRKQEIASEMSKLKLERKIAQLELMQKAIDLTKDLDVESRNRVFEILLNADLQNLAQEKVESEKDDKNAEQ
jgi:hypothetical protein